MENLPKPSSPNWVPERAPEVDTVARDANVDGLLTLILLRHSAWEHTSDSNPHKPTYLEARDNAIRELKWRVQELWTENDLRTRKAQRLVETIRAIGGVIKEREGYEQPIESSKVKLFW